MQYTYYSKRSQMTADLKRVTHRVRTESANRMKVTAIPVFRFNKAGDAIPSGITKDVLATPMSPRDRHALAWRKE